MTGAVKTVLITGASSGIGLACARGLAARGMRVFGTSRRPGPFGEPFEFVTMDVTDDDSVAAAVDQVLARAGTIDVLINNAGQVLAGPLELTSIAEARDQLDTNLLGPLRVSQAVLPGMRARRSGLIIMIGSIGGLMGMPFQGVYAASKFALEGLTESLRHELRPFGVHATIVEPGDIRTSMTDNRKLAAASQTHTDYARWMDATMTIVEREERGGPPPELVAAQVERIVRGGPPKPRYAVGKLEQRAAIWAKRLLPARLFERGLARYFGLG